MPVKLTSKMFYNNPRYKSTTTNTIFNVGAPISLPTSSIIVVGLKEKREIQKKSTNFAQAAKVH